MGFTELDMAKQEPRFQTIAIMGAEKTGKTRFIGTCPRPCLVYSFDDGWATLAGQEGIKVKLVEGLTCGADVERDINSMLIKIPEYTWPDGKVEPYKTIAFDPISFLSDTLMEEESKKSNDGFTVYRNLLRIQSAFLKNVRKFKNVNIIVTTHIEIKYDETTGQEMFLADLNGKIRNSFGANFDAVLFTKVVPKGNKAEYFVCPVPDSRKKSGIRVPMGCEDVFSNMEKPDFGHLMSKFQQAVKK